MSEMRINGDRLWAALMELAKIGATPKGGVKRLALTDLDKQGRDLVVGWGRDAGCRSPSTRSAMSSCAATAATTALPPVMTGSHIDTQPTGGKFDGNYGVLAGLEVVRTLNDHGIRPRRRSRWRSGPTRRARASCR
jgi:N-carbamoyl-L-amino-acid hydrolase